MSSGRSPAPTAKACCSPSAPIRASAPTAKAVVDEVQGQEHRSGRLYLYTYAAVQVWAQAAAQAKTTDPKKVAEVIHKGKWNTVLGPISYDTKGDITVIDYVFYVWERTANTQKLQGGS